MGSIRKMLRAGWGQHSYLSTGACLNLGLWLLLGVSNCCLADIPTITLDPLSQEVVLYTVSGCASGDCRSVRFVSAATSDEPLTYQWLKDGFPAGDNGRISGVTESEMAIKDVQIEDAGAYSFVASNAAGSVTSAPGVLKVTVPVLKDLRLEDAVRRELGKPEGGISCSDLERLTNLVAYDRHIESLAGIECARNMQLLWVGGNYVEDLGPLSGLSELRQLAVYNNHGKLNDLSPIRGLTNLTYLDVRFNPGITNLNVAGELSHLQELYLGGNEIGDIGYVTNLTELRTLDIGAGVNVDLMVLGLLPSLTQLDVSYGIGVNLTVLAGLTNLEAVSISGQRTPNVDWLTNLSGLKTLNAVGTGLTEIPPLNGLTNLESLNLGRNAISDTSALSPLQSLRCLWLYDNQITSFSGLSGLAALRNLNLDRNRINEIGSVLLPKGLKALQMEGNGITNSSGIGGLTQLEELSLGANRIEEIAAVANLFNLKSLLLFSNQLSEATALSGLSNLVCLDLSHNGLTNGATYSTMTQLLSLKLAGNNLQELTWVAGLQELRELDLSDNGVNDVTSLTNLSGLRLLGVAGNAVVDWSVLSRITNLERLNIGRNQLEQSAFLSVLSGLRDLNLSGNLMTNLSGVVTLTNLERLDVGGNRLMEISGLRCLARLGRVDLHGNLLGSSQTAQAELSCLEQGQVEVVSSPQRIGPTITFTNMGRRYGSNYWPMALGETAQIGFMVTDDVVSEGPFELGMEVSDVSLLPQGTVVVQGSGTNWVVTIKAPPIKMGQCTVTLRATDILGVRVRAAIVVELTEPADILDVQLESQIRAELGVQVQQLTRGAMESLETLNAEELNVTNLSGLELATNLTRLDLGGNAIVSIQPIEGVVGLTRLSLSNNLLTDISGIRGLTNLTELDLSDNPLTNFEALSELKSLRTLVSADDRIEDLSFVTNLTQLLMLDVSTNRLRDLVALTGLTNLSWLGLEQNRLRNLDPLTNLAGLTYIDSRLNLLSVGTDPALDQLGSMAVLLDDPQRESPFLDIRTNWVIGCNGPSTLLFNIFDSGPADEELGVGIGASNLEVNFNLSGPSADGTWQLSANPIVPPVGSNLVIQVTLRVTNDVGLAAEKLVSVIVSPLTVIDADLLGDTNLVWRTDADAPWFGQSLMTRDGHAVAQSGVVPNFGFSALETDLTGPGRLSFWWRVSSEENYDWLTFSIGDELLRISGESDWERKVVNVPPGLQTARWEYRKDNDASHGFDAGWVEAVIFEPGIWLEVPNVSPDGEKTILFHGVPGRIYELLSSTNWLEWRRISPPVLVTNVSQALSDTNSAEGFRLYQVHELFLIVEPPIIQDPSTIEIRVHNPTGFKPEVEVSEDMVNWLFVGEINDTANVVSILDVFNTNAAPRFYRAVWHW